MSREILERDREASADGTADLRRGCRGVVPLSARLEDWQAALCRQPDLLSRLLDLHGSPLNLIDPAPMGRNAGELEEVGAASGLDLKVYFARKANKSLALVDEARRLGLGLDLAGRRELQQALDREFPAAAMVMTAAVKPTDLLRLCIDSGTTVVIDNEDELRSLIELATVPTPIALRLSPTPRPGRAPSRFGFEPAEALAVVERLCPPDPSRGPRIEGLHFHLDGYDAAERVAAIEECLRLIELLRDRGHRPGFIDIGGGIPMSYLDSEAEWRTFWEEHRRALSGERDPITYENFGLGLIPHEGEVLGTAKVYPYHQGLIRGPWLAEVLSASIGTARGRRTVAEALRGAGLELRCQPGRSLLDGAGMTVARVEFRKRRRDGTWLIGAAMNRTQCRSTSEDFLVDPLLVRPKRTTPVASGEDTGPIEGYLVGAYCIERELLSWRAMRFPDGVRRGDLIVFPNTGGYLMHILESSSHQIPLARNLVVDADGRSTLDPIDAAG